MIPCVGFLTFNNPQYGFQLLNSLDTSIDHLVIINNGELSHETWERAAQGKANHVHVHTQYNSGVACGWNMIIVDVPDAEYWMIINDDVVLAPGDLEKLAQATVDSSEDVVQCVHGDIHTSMMTIKSSAIEKLGYFDENFYPAYFEDTDYNRRILIGNVKTLYVPGCKTKHLGSRSNISDPLFVWKWCARTQEEELTPYYIDKWGAKGGQEILTKPNIRPFDLDLRKRLLDIRDDILKENGL